MRSFHPGASKAPMKFRMPTAENFVPIRLDLDIDGQRFKDAFTWNPNDPDSEVNNFAKRTVKDLKLPPTFVTQIAQSIQTQLAEFHSYEGQEMHIKEKIVPLKIDLRVNNTVIRDQFLWDISNLESDPEEFARTFCKDLDIGDPEVGPAIAVSIREQLYEIATQSISSARETRVGKKGRRGADIVANSKAGNTVDLGKLFGSKGSVIRKRKEWYLYEPIVDILSNEEVGALDAREELNARESWMKKKRASRHAILMAELCLPMVDRRGLLTA
ncbi:chromatin structure-remodeling complex protein BSH-like isoform X2 [Musa acuminata AAA Group]